MNIQIREQDQHDDQTFTASLTFNGGNRHDITIRDPFADVPKREALLEWYFESWVDRPYLDEVDAERAAASVRDYGEQLFDQLFSDRRAYHNYDKGGDDLHFEIVGTPAFHALHWEALRDPDKPLPLATEHPFVRRNVEQVATEISVQPSPTLNVLLVTARPSGRRDVGYRTIQQPLFDALDDAHLHTHLDIVRPGTWEALVRHLEQTRTQHGKGYYHIVHFDLHGGLLTYDQYLKYKEQYVASGYQFETPATFDFAQTDLTEYDGVQAFLLFDGKVDGVANCVSADDVAKLLQTYHVPIALLNACQSGKQVGGAETSLGSRLVRAGVQWVVAMGYSVTVSAAQKLMTVLYRQLLAGTGLPTALRQGRLELLRDQERKAGRGNVVDLEDWLLPVVYQNQAVELALRRMTAQEKTDFYAREAYRDSATYHTPTYGFHGRDLDLLQLERRLCADNVLLVRGMGGAGKTTLLHHVAAWWQRTRWVRRVWYFGYDERAHTHQQIITAIGKRLWGERGYIVELQPLALAVQEKEIVRRLRGERHLLLLDNLESVTGTALAIENRLSVAEQGKLRRFVERLRGGKSLVLLGSRSGVEWLIGATGAVYDLPGLDAGGERTLVDAILTRHGLLHYRDDDSENRKLNKLIRLLDGYPLALEVVLANLTESKPSVLLTDFETGDIRIAGEFTDADRTNNIIKCIEVSHSNLSHTSQQLLLAFAPFTHKINIKYLSRYAELLKNRTSLREVDFDHLWETIQLVISSGLLTSSSQSKDYLTMQPVFSYYLRVRLSEFPVAMQVSINEVFQDYILEIADMYDDLLHTGQNDDFLLGRMLISLEYQNFLSVLTMRLEQQTSFRSLLYAMDSFLDEEHKIDERREFLDYILSFDKDTPKKIDVELDFILAYGRRGTFEFDTKGNMQIAINHHNQVLIRAEALDFDENKRSILVEQARFQLGLAYEQMGALEDAKFYFEEGLKLNEAAKARKNNRSYLSSRANNLYYLGRIEFKFDKFDIALEHFQECYNTYLSLEGTVGIARSSFWLGRYYFATNKFEEATLYFESAAKLFLKRKSKQDEAFSYYYLGKAQFKQGLVNEAKESIQKSLDIALDLGSNDIISSSFEYLGTIATAENMYETAARYFSISLAHNPRHVIALTQLVSLIPKLKIQRIAIELSNAMQISIEEATKRLLEGDE